MGGTAAKATTGNPELADRFDRVLGETVEALDESGIRYVFIGGIASGGLGRPRSTRDIDVFVRPEDAELALRALARKGFRTEQTDPVWLYKGFKENVLVDVIFKSKGEIYLDQEMWERMTAAEFHGKRLRLVGAEDLVIIKALAHSEVTPGHWHDGLALLSRSNLDWDYLVKRARRAPRRLLSLLLYAQSNDIWVPKFAIDQLYRTVFGDQPPHHTQGLAHAPLQDQGVFQNNPRHDSSLRVVEPSPAPGQQQAQSQSREAYWVARLRERIAEDPRTNELDIQIEVTGSRLLLRGEVLTEDRRAAIQEIARDLFPGFQIENQVRLSQVSEPHEAEEIP